jgi:hypothetical protein
MAASNSKLMRAWLPARGIGSRLLFGVPHAVGGKQVLG